ncbi:MAG: (d)CMP kinase [Gemmatimonadetes bacterium]|nr:(d)CMP kinase [Gemmatimonadota bacterium]
MVTIDGPAGSGKSTTAAVVAERLGLRHLDSGALYRALTLALVRNRIPSERWPHLDRGELAALDLRLDPTRGGFEVLLDGAFPGAELRSPGVTEKVSVLARVPEARARLLELQRSAPTYGGVVADGRDMGTVVFPEAPLKVFLTATLRTRARRRLRQDGKEEVPLAVSEESARIHERDSRDEERAVAPLLRPPGALVIDTTELTFEEQVERIVRAAAKALGSAR